jgi:competence protein ComEA
MAGARRPEKRFQAPTNSANRLIFVSLGICCLLLLTWLSACRSSALVITAAPLPTLTPPLPTATLGPVTISIDGAVNHPGQYTLPPRSRVNDAVRAAGGPAADADLERINLALILHDGEHIHVPSVGEIIPTSTPYGIMAGGRIDINLAEAALLETLPGIGPTIAQRIVEYREMNGPFETIEEIQRVQGIGPSKFEGIEDLIVVGVAP